VSSDIQSVEVSYFLQMTEDESKVTNAVAALVGDERPPAREVVEGHFGNTIVWVKHHIAGDPAQAAIRRILVRIAPEERRTILGDLGSYLDEHNTLYLRLNKQALVMRGDAVLGNADPIRVRVKPRSYKIKGDIGGFYRRLFQEGTGE